MDGTMEINATNLEAIAYNIAGTAQVMCSHDGCGVNVSYHESLRHQIACPHDRCNCTEQGCDFAAPPSALLVHLAEAHSIQVHRLEYGKSIEFRVTMTHPCSPCRLLVVEGDDGSVFVLYIDALGPAIVLSLVCVSSATSVWPLYRVKIWAHGPPPSSKSDCRRDVVKMSADASGSASPGAVVFEELTSFLVVPGPYLVGAGSSKELRFYIRICKQM
jgi:E3 ubiquitin-protein ligase SIAH1